MTIIVKTEDGHSHALPAKDAEEASRMVLEILNYGLMGSQAVTVKIKKG